MLLLKSNPELKEIFSRLIKTMGAPVVWNEIFVILNHNLILAGKTRSLIFNFADKRAYTNILELPLEDKEIEQLPEHPLLTNLLNMTLYAFGKWNSIKGVTVEKDYSSLNKLFQNIMKEIRIEPSFRDDYFRFYQNGLQITYEDVISTALKAVTEVSQEDEEEGEGENEEVYGLGLWHDVGWKEGSFAFEKQGLEEKGAKSRIGNNFYMINYICPSCGEKLHMTVYPDGKEELIETEEGRVFLARAYTCDGCNCFYTPKPGKLLGEGEVYWLDFEDDQIAYDDYLEHIGRNGARISSYKLNKYESVPKSREKEGDSVSDETKEEDGGFLEGAGRKEESAGFNKNKSRNKAAFGFGKSRGSKEGRNRDESRKGRDSGRDRDGSRESRDSGRNRDESRESGDSGKGIRNSGGKAGQGHEEMYDKSHPPAYEADGKNSGTGHNHKLPAQNLETGASSQSKYDFSMKTIDDLKALIKRTEKANPGIPGEKGRKSRNPAYPREYYSQEYSSPEYLKAAKSQLKERLKTKYDARMKTIGRMTERQLADLKKQIQAEDVLPEADVYQYIHTIDDALYENEKNTIQQKTEAGRSKTYAEITRMMEEIEHGEGLKEERKEALQKLEGFKAARGRQEVEHLVKNMPLHMNRKQYGAYLEKIKQYKDVDISPYHQQLEQKRDIIEKEEITILVKRAGKKDRKALEELSEQLKKQDFKKENVSPYLEKIHDKIHEMDEAEIARICPDIRNASFEEGLAAYEKIREGLFLPELKTNTLEMIRIRLTKIKTDENVQLVRKLKKEMEKKIKDFSALHFYDARQSQNRQEEEDQSQIMQEEPDKNDAIVINCALYTYAAARNEFEFPILVCDSSRKGNGKKGFVLTPDHIFYRDLLDSGVIDIPAVEEVGYEGSKFKKGIYVKSSKREKEKLPNGVSQNEKEAFAKVLHEFVGYLQDKPESRNIEYLVKEEHEIICCYRCGYTYKGGNVCPKCGNKVNN